MRALQTGSTIRLANHTVLITRTGEEHAIDDSAARRRFETMLGPRLAQDRCSATSPSGDGPKVLRARISPPSSNHLTMPSSARHCRASFCRGTTGLSGCLGAPAEEGLGSRLPCSSRRIGLVKRSTSSSELFAGERIEHFETVRVSKDGRPIDISLTISPIRNAEGVIIGASKVARDISHRKSLEARNAELREWEQLARQEAEAANRAKDEFLAMLGHELRNPLSPILTALQLMKLRGGGGLEREREVIERQVGHLTRLVEDLLDVSRITRGKVAIKEEDVEIAESVAKAIGNGPRRCSTSGPTCLTSMSHGSSG